MGLRERFRSPAAEEPSVDQFPLKNVSRIQAGIGRIAGIERLAEQMVGREDFSPEGLDHWLRGNLNKRRKLLAEEPDKEKQIDSYALDFADTLTYMMHLSGQAVSPETTLLIPGFDFDDTIVQEATARVHGYFRRQGFLVHYSFVPRHEPLLLDGEDPHFYRLYQLSVSGWNRPSPNGSAEA